MAAGTGNLPYPGMDFVPFDILTAEELDQIVANYESLADGSGIGDGAVNALKVDFGGSGTGIWWEEIGRETLGSAGDTITVSDLPARKFLKVLLVAAATGGNIDPVITFNSDTGNNYSHRISEDGASDSVSATRANIAFGGGATAQDLLVTAEIINRATREKMLIAHTVRQGAAGAGGNTSRREITGKWVNTSNAIATITATNVSTGDFAAGSELIVLGHD